MHTSAHTRVGRRVQVHVAEDHKGHKLAVKVQHGGLRESSAADIATVEALVHAVKWVFPVSQ